MPVVSVPSEMRCRHSPVGRHTTGHWAHSRSLGTLPRVVPVLSFPSEMSCGHSLVDGNSPQSLGTLPGAGYPAPCGSCSPSSLRDEVHTVPPWVAGWRGDWSCCCRGIPQSAPEGLFLLGKNPPAQSCSSLHTRKGLSSHTAHLSKMGTPGMTLVCIVCPLFL